ncbi:hypothetical protein XA68_11134 [Ophiocordyceps unilateralis]|uniref:Protein kinase domain-containing protein n=1 Tax=Ophiocordyceps unilateralis TaxID=268505 RepID=A0A2A9PHF7_OPHUN|nr:hypothetical protein XA68_11134 [Ophiocordyceps unilateralis]
MSELGEELVRDAHDINIERLLKLADHVVGVFTEILSSLQGPSYRIIDSLDKQAARFKCWRLVAGLSLDHGQPLALARLRNAPAMMGALLAALEYLCLQLLDRNKPNDRVFPMDTIMQIEMTITTLHQLSVSNRRTALLTSTDLLVQLDRSRGDDPTTELSIELLSKRCWSAFSAKYFIPNDALHSVVDMASTGRVLAAAFPELHSSKISAYTTIVCQDGDSVGLRRVFAALMLLRKINALGSFIKLSVNDGHLPLLPGDLKNRLVEANDAETIDQFIELQWLVLAPQLIRHYDAETPFMDHSAIMPCPEARIIPKFGEDPTMQNSEQSHAQPIVLQCSPVWKVKIHPGHIVASHKRETPYFALKQLQGLSEREVVNEMANLRELRYLSRPQEHVVELLDSFCYRDNFYLVFDWAEDNLMQYWQRSGEPKLTKGLLRWASSQISGLTRGLAAIHDELMGYHGDITPQNILRFTEAETSSSYGILKLSDFGLAQFPGRHEPASSSERFYDQHCDPTYQSPECQPPESRNDRPMNVTQKSDVWPLGCVYLSFVTWLLCGWSGVQEFSRQRFDEHELDTQLDSFFKLEDGTQPGLVLKTSVSRRMELLESLETQASFTSDLVDIIRGRMLQINPRRRLSCRALSDRLLDMDKRCQNEQRGPEEEKAALISSPWVVQQIYIRYGTRALLEFHLQEIFPEGCRRLQYRGDVWIVTLPRALTEAEIDGLQKAIMDESC